MKFEIIDWQNNVIKFFNIVEDLKIEIDQLM